MKRILPLLLLLLLSLSGLWAQQPLPVQPASNGLGEVDTTWPGVRFQLFKVERIPGDRLLLTITVLATPQVPPAGTLIGIQPVIPKDATPQMIASGLYRPDPFSIEPAIMTDEATKQTYRTVKPRPGGPNYIPGILITTLHPNSSSMMSIQFPAPPLPKPVDGIIPKQTVSILLPNAKGPIVRVVIPPPPSSPAAAL